MKIWFDTEFHENGKTIDLISIGLVREDGATYYAETDFAHEKCGSDWLKANVRSHLKGCEVSRPRMAREIVDFAGRNPEFWAYYADYDWVVLCQLYGTMMDLPKSWPMFCMDVKQWAIMLGDPKLPEQTDAEHNALNDALWTRRAWEFLNSRFAEAEPPAGRGGRVGLTKLRSVG